MRAAMTRRRRGSSQFIACPLCIEVVPAIGKRRSELGKRQILSKECRAPHGKPVRVIFPAVRALMSEEAHQIQALLRCGLVKC